MRQTIQLAHRSVGIHHEPFIIAEMSGNHNQSLDRAMAIVEAAARTGVQALKLQTYTADTLTLDVKDGDFQIRDPGSLWAGQNLHQLYQQAYTPWDWHGPLFKRARELGLICLSSPFDETAVDFLETLDCPAYKIASFENNHLPLIRKAASTGKPLIISTGMATEAEIGEAVEAARGAGCRELILLKCTSTYPASPEDSHLRTIPVLREKFQCEVGLSDHTLGIGVSLASIGFGATVMEKHFTLSRAEGGVDSVFSMEPAEMSQLVVESRRAWQSLGQVTFGAGPQEEKSRIFRRSLYIAEDVKAGEVLTPRNVRIVRPGFGLPPKHYEQVLGRKIIKAASKGTPLSWDLLARDGGGKSFESENQTPE